MTACNDAMSVLEKACLTPRNKPIIPQSSSTLHKLVSRYKPSIKQIQHLILIATKCNNPNAIFEVLVGSLSYLNFPGKKRTHCDDKGISKMKEQEEAIDIVLVANDNETGDSLLHLMCRHYGWNSCALMVVEFSVFIRAIYSRQDEIYDGAGIFSVNSELETPLHLSCEYGCSLSDVISSILQCSERRNAFASLSIGIDFVPNITTMDILMSNDQNILLLIQLIAQFTDNDRDEINFLMGVLMEINSTILTEVYLSNFDGSGGVGCLPIHLACYYQNPALIEFCILNSSLPVGGLDASTFHKRNKSLKSSTTPLDYLITNLGSDDDQYTWQCLDVCVSALPTLQLLQLIIEKIQPQTIRRILIEKNVLNQIIKRYNICLTTSCTNNQFNRNGTILSSAIRTANEWKLRDDHNKCLFHDICQFLLRCNLDTELHQNSLQQLASFQCWCNSHQCYRLPLHLALECNIHWEKGLDLVLKANTNALEEIDPFTKLAPFMLAAADTRVSGSEQNCDLNSIYELLRSRPTIIFQCQT